jgi:hypothetical protein
MILSRDSVIYMHHTGEPTQPIGFLYERLSHFITVAQMHDPSIRSNPVPRGRNGPPQPSLRLDTIAWAYGVVRSRECYNIYDKVALVLNLIRAPISSRLVSLPSSQGRDSAVAETNVHKILNAFAILSGDYSLLLVSHGRNNPLRQQATFIWADIPGKPEVVSDAWFPRHYAVEKDTNAVLNNT